LAAVILLIGFVRCLTTADPPGPPLERRFAQVVQPFVKTYCLGCHGADKPKAKLDLSGYTTAAAGAEKHRPRGHGRERVEAGEMPPVKAPRQPTAHERRAVLDWIRDFREEEARRNAGDPGPVLARRLSNAEYDYTIRDLTGVDIRPTKEFPVDPANQAGVDNSGESLAMSPALVKKYLAAARLVAEHVLFLPSGLSFAPYPVVTDQDRDKYGVNRIVDFYKRQPLDYADYFLAAWRYHHRSELRRPRMTLADAAREAKVSPAYLNRIWTMLTAPGEDVGPLAALQARWKSLPLPEDRKRSAEAPPSLASRSQASAGQAFALHGGEPD